MHKPRVAVLFALAGVLAVTPVSLSAETLAEALANAYASNPRLRAQRAAVRAIDEGVAQALAGFRPTTLAKGSYGKRQQDSVGTFTAGRSNLNPLTGQLEISQLLYRGGRTVAATRQAEEQVLAGRAQLKVVEQDVLLIAVKAYIDVLRDQVVVQLNRNNESVLRRQLEATQDRFRVGEVTRTDVAQAEARLSRATSDRVRTEANLVSTRAGYRRVVGRAPEALVPVPPLSGLPVSEQEAIAVALEDNPTLLAAKFAETASLHAIRVARGSLLPTVSLNGEFTHAEQTATRNSESDVAQVTAQVVIPLYQAGSSYALVRQRRQTNQQRRIEVEETRRSVVERVTTAWVRFATAGSLIDSRTEQVRAAEIALDGLRQEAEVGLRTTLDVLDAEQELLDARVGLVVAERDEYVAGFELRSAIGRLTAANLNLDVALYDPAEHYNRARNKWWGRYISGQ